MPTPHVLKPRRAKPKREPVAVDPHRVSIRVESKPSSSLRARQASAMFDVPASESQVLEWGGSVDINAEPWNVGLIVGPSGAGKSTVARSLFGDRYHPVLKWNAPSVVDDVADSVGVQQITEAFGAVGFNTIPAWLRPFAVLSNGEQFRCDLARRLLELPDPIVVDEFTSVVDRQVAKVGSHAVQKYVRRQGRKLVAVTCHYDVIDWLQPDWIIEPASGTLSLARRSVQPRPRVEVEVRRVDYSVWSTFAPFHYLTRDLLKGAWCFAACVEGRPVAFAGVLCLPHPSVKDLRTVSRLVTLPDWQGLGLAFVLADAIGSAMRATGFRLICHPAHPALIRAYAKSPRWALRSLPGKTIARGGVTSRWNAAGFVQSRQCASCEYIGPAADDVFASRLFLGDAVPCR